MDHGLEHPLDPGLLMVIVLTFAMGALFAYLLKRLQLPTLLAFILTGIILGPNGLNIVQGEAIRPLAQVGIIFLLFIVGLELSVDKLRQLRYQAPAAGIMQLSLTTLALTLAFRYLALMPWQLAFLLGSILSLSSTAIVLKSLDEHREIDSDHGRLILGILIIQDLSIIPLMALVPALTQPFQPEFLLDIALLLAKALLFGAVAVGIGLKVVPVFLDRLAATNQKEVFTIALLCIGLGMATLTGMLGLSYEAGAFVAGLALSQSMYCQQIIADSKGFRDVFITLFFISMGLLFDGRYLADHPVLMLGITAGLIVMKGITAYGAVRILNFPHKTAIWAALSLFQVGEFSFVLLERTLQTVQQEPLWQDTLAFWSPMLIDAIIISMFLTPLVMRGLHQATAPYLHPGRGELGAGTASQFADLPRRVLIGGYGPIARNLATALQAANVPYSVVEMNVQTVRKLQNKGIYCLYGDISRPDILEQIGIREAGILALTFPDIRTSEAAVQHAKRLNPNVHCIVRSRYRVDVDRLYKLGVDTVIYEELETGISFIFNIMRHIDHPILETDRLITMVRNRENSLFSEAVSADHPVFGRFSLLEGTKIEWIEIGPQSSIIGKTLQEAQLRQRTGVNVIAVVSAADKTQSMPDPDLVLNVHDVLVGVGTVDQLHALEHLLYG